MFQAGICEEAQEDTQAIDQEQRQDGIVPRANEPLHPTLPDRIVPAPPAVPQQNSSSRGAKPSLAWRQKALLLSMEKFKNSETQAKQTANPYMRCCSGSYSETLMALASSCSKLGFKTEQLNNNAGELLVSKQDTQVKIVFCIWEQSKSKTWISAGIEKGKSSSSLKVLTEILDSTFDTFEKRGRI